MPVRETTTIEAVAGGPNQRVYIPQEFRVQHVYPFRAKEPIALQVIETACGREVVVLTKETVQVDEEESTLSLERSGSDIQSDLTALAEGDDE